MEKRKNSLVWVFRLFGKVSGNFNMKVLVSPWGCTDGAAASLFRRILRILV